MFAVQRHVGSVLGIKARRLIATIRSYTLLLLSYGGNCCLLAVLPYHPKYKFGIAMPGFGDMSVRNLDYIVDSLSNRRKGRIGIRAFNRKHAHCDPESQWSEAIIQMSKSSKALTESFRKVESRIKT
jgi:hypothetical protein